MRSLAVLGVNGKVIGVPPSESDHPANVYPDSVGRLGAAVIAPPEINELGVTAEPLLES
ncbi:unannotated protein [freshwater metagenome]|uniref:Unannotated protein n=1 Tax=freshwater metagenome TaxID=449393 RepID=A0A6J7TLY6_9ZZZZ